MYLRLKYISLVLLTWSCQRAEQKISQNQAADEIRNQIALKKTGEIEFLLDSMTSANLESVEILENIKNSERYLTFLNERTKCIYRYNYDTKKLVSKTCLQQDGPMGVGLINGHHMKSIDSIYVLDPWTSKLSLVDTTGKILQLYSFAITSKAKIYAPNLRLASTNPLYIRDGKFYITGSTPGEFDDENENNRPVIAIYDISSRKLDHHLLSYPDTYKGANWGGLSFRAVYSANNEKANCILVSFPADHNIYKVDLVTQEISKHYAGSSLFGDIISLDRPKSFYDNHALESYFAKEPSYSSIIFDKYRNVYYRIADLPLDEFNPEYREKSVKPFSIIILDKDLKKVGETKIPHLSHSRLTFYVSKEGLNLRKYVDNEDYLTFTTFVPKSIQH